MTYSTPASLVGAGQGVSIVCFSFSLWVSLSQLKHHSETTLKHWMQLLDLSDQRLPTLFFWLPAVPVPPFAIQILFQPPNFSLYLMPLVHKSMHPIRHPFPFLFSILCLLGQADMLLMQPLDFSHHLLHLCSEGSGNAFKNWSTQDSRGRGLSRLQEADWYQNRISPKLGQEFLFPEPVPPPLAGVFVLETPIELHCDSKHISTFYGGYFIGL